MQEKSKKRNIKAIVLSLILLCTSVVGIMTTQTNFNKTTIRPVSIISESGYRLSMDIYIPDGVNEENPAPTILLQHGGNSNKEQAKHYAIELARRGYVVVNNEMYSMGQSEPLPDSKWLTSGRGLYDAVKYASTLPFVDKDQIGLLGISRGGKAAGESLGLDKDENNLIKAIFLAHSDPIVRNTEGYVDVYQDRDVAVVADKNDEFFFTEKANNTGIYSNDANQFMNNLTSPYNYIASDSAQTFLGFGADPATSDKFIAETVYEKNFENGNTGSRIIHVTNGVHNLANISPNIVEYSASFFQRVLPTATELKPNDFIYPIGYAFIVIGIISLISFMISSVVYLLRYIAFFKVADYGVPHMRVVTDTKGKLWFWSMQIISAIFSVAVMWFLNKNGFSSYRDVIFRSGQPIYLGLLCLICGTFSLISSIFWYHLYGKKHGFDLTSIGLYIQGKALIKTILAAIIGVFLVYLIVFICEQFLNVDFVIMLWGLQMFGPDRVSGILTTIPLYIIFYTVMSVSVNCFNFNDVLGKSKWGGRIFYPLIAAAPAIIVMLYVYGSFMITGWNPMFGGLASSGSAAMSLPPVIFLAILSCRLIYEKTGNAYLGGFINGIFTTIITWSACEIRIPEASDVYGKTGLLITLMIVCALLIIGSVIYFIRIKKKNPI